MYMKKYLKRLSFLLLGLATLGMMNNLASLSSGQTPSNRILRSARQSSVEFTYHDLGNIYLDAGGGLECIDDGDDSTFCWFGSAPTVGSSYLQMNFSDIVTISDVRVLFDTNDKMPGELSYSSDGENFTYLATIDKNEQVLDIRSNPIEASCLRLTSTIANGGAWVKIFDFSINNLSDRPIVSYEGFAFVNVSWNDVNNMTDKNMDTYTWFDWHNEAGAHITLQYSQVQTITNIYLFASHPNTDDHFKYMTFYISTDGEQFIQVGEECYIDQYEVMVTFETPLEASYVRVVSKELEETGFAIREFGINHEKVEAPITFANDSVYTYSSSGITPSYTIPYLTEAEIHYTYHSEFYSNDAPVKPGWYALIVTVKESLYYQSTMKYTVFCIQDTKDHFIEEWNLAMEKGVCDYASQTGDNANYEYLLEVYRDCLTEETRSEIDSYQWSDASTIAETMAYIDSLRALNNQETASQLNLLSGGYDSSIAMLMLSIISGGFLILVGYYFTAKKKYN